MNGSTPAPDWQPYEDGATIGLTGSEGGVIVRDDEHTGGARITLERECRVAPFAITCGIYGWAVHTRFIADEPSAMHAYDAMRADLDSIIALIPGEDDPDAGAKSDAVNEAVAAFMAKFP